MGILEGVQDALPQQWAKAVVIDRAFMREYVQASLRISWDPHSQYAREMEYVCRFATADFIKAVSTTVL